MLRACIHRGAAQIGGTCIELECDGSRLILDIGRPLDVPLDELTVATLPRVAGLQDGDSSIVGLVISHGHPDHYGLVGAAHESIPVFIGEAIHRILSEGAFFGPAGEEIRAAGYLRDRRPLGLGPFVVTPMLVDHSAFDAYALVVEAGGRRLMYSGDLRAHGRKEWAFQRLLDDPPRPIHTLMLEGTTVLRPAGGLSEREVEEELVRQFEQTEGIVLACYSAQNIDRLVSLYKAARRSGRAFVIDLYAASIARATRNEKIPQVGWDGVEVFVPRSQRARVFREKAFERTEWVKGRRLFEEDLAARRSELVLTFRSSMAEELERAAALDGARAVWSMWAGYRDSPSGQKLEWWFRRKGIPLAQVHSSGHARTADLQALARAVAADRVVPVHTDAPDRFPELFENVELKADGEWWEV